MDSKEKAFSEDGVRETETLETFGYTQELKRSFSLFGMVGFCFNIVASWIALSAVLVVGIGAGGPPVIIYSWIFICLFSLAVALSLAEMCSAFPVAGGQYSWVMILTPKSIARGMSWITGWFMCVGYLTDVLHALDLIYSDSVKAYWSTGHGRCGEQCNGKLHPRDGESQLSRVCYKTVAYGPRVMGCSGKLCGL